MCHHTCEFINKEKHFFRELALYKPIGKTCCQCMFLQNSGRSVSSTGPIKGYWDDARLRHELCDLCDLVFPCFRSLYDISDTMKEERSESVWGKLCILHVTLIKQNSHCEPVWTARVSICGSILYKITSWQWMRAESIIHMETNKENNVSLTEWHVCSLTTAPAAASVPVGRQPAVFSSHMPPPPTHTASLSLSLSLFTPRKKERPGKPPACRPHTAYVDQRRRALGFLCHRRVPDYTPAKQMHPPTPITSLKTLPQSLPTPLPLTKALPSCCDLNMRAPPKKRGHLAHALEAKKKELNCSCHGNVPKQD